MDGNIPPTGGLDVDLAAISCFVDLVLGNLEGFVAVRTIPETGTAAQHAQSEYHRPVELVAALKRLAPRAAQQAKGLYVVPATVERSGSAKASDIRQTGVVVVDVDIGDIESKVLHLRQHLGTPTLEVASGGTTADGQVKRHVYWKLAEAAAGDDLGRVRALRESIAAKVGADPSFKSLHQPIRVPGSIHGKNGIKTQVKVTAQRNLIYDLADLENAARHMPSISSSGIHGKKSDRPPVTLSFEELARRSVRAAAVDGITRFDAISKVIGHWIRNHRRGMCSLEDAWDAVVDYNAAMIDPPWSEDRLRRDFDVLVLRDVTSNGPMPASGALARSALAAGSNDALAQAFVSRHGNEWRYIATWGAWYHWQDGKWANDETANVRELARLVCRDAAHQAGKDSEARQIASNMTIVATLKVAGSDPQIATAAADFDAHPWLLNTPAGVIDLRDGDLREPDPDMLLSQMTDASPGVGCPRWTSFLTEITAGDQSLQDYLRRLAGYCLTGITTEQVFGFFHGAGANGKSVFLQTLAAVLGDYAKIATSDTFMSSRGERHLTELAGLRAARLVIVPETEQGRAWAEARIKAVTGGEKIRANFMRQDHFEFTPQFKLIVAGNHRPALTGIGEAMRRRLHLIPFEVTIPVEKRDKDLARKLLAERDGILGWMLRGCAEWQRLGLEPPTSVRTAVEGYFEEEDIVGNWIEMCCSTGAQYRAAAQELYANWSAWADVSGYEKGSQKTLGSALKERGFQSGKVNGNRGWLGIAPRIGPSSARRSQ